jgi:hypothetical protein
MDCKLFDYFIIKLFAAQAAEKEIMPIRNSLHFIS